MRKMYRTKECGNIKEDIPSDDFPIICIYYFELACSLVSCSSSAARYKSLGRIRTDSVNSFC